MESSPQLSTATMFQEPAQLPSPAVEPLSPPASFVCPQDMTKAEPSDAATSAASTVNDDDPSSSSSPAKKKRKSWGQVLPTPTTNLPPRKRAKTEAEKEQRRYERVQRNRQAAHASRMRKQEETDQLRADNNHLKQDISALEAEIKRLREENTSLRQGDFTFTHPHRPITPPPQKYESTSEEIDSAAPPSLLSSSLSSSSNASPTVDSIATPPQSQADDGYSLFAKQSDPSHSAVEVGFAEYQINLVSEEKQQSNDTNDTMMAMNDLMVQHSELQNAASAPVFDFSMTDFVDFDMAAHSAVDVDAKIANMSADAKVDFSHSAFAQNAPMDALNFNHPYTGDFDFTNLLDLDHFDSTTSDR